MTEQIGYNELIKYVFNNMDIEELIENKYFESSSSITDIGYQRIKEYLENNQQISDFNLLLGILSTLAYGHPEEIEDNIQTLIINNKELIRSNIDSLEKIIHGTLKLEELNSINSIINMQMSFELLNFLDNDWIEYRLHKKYFYGINYLLVYFSMYCYNDFESWFLSTKSDNLKTIFASQLLSSSNLYQFKKIYLNSNIDFLRAISKVTFFTHKEKFFEHQKQITDLAVDKESIYFIMLYIKKNFYKLTQENINTFEQTIENLKQHFQFISTNNLSEFTKYMNFEVIYKIIHKIDNSDNRKNLLYQILNEIKNKFNSFFDKSYISSDEIEKVNLYGQIVLVLQESEEIINIKKCFDELYNKISEPYYFYRFNDKWKLSLKELVYYLIILYIFYFDVEEKHSVITTYKEKINNTFKEYNFYNIDEFKALLKQVELPNANKS